MSVTAWERLELVPPPTPDLLEVSAGMDKLAMTASTLAAARRATETAPTEGQAEAGNYKKGKVAWQGLTISIENPKGSTRSGTSGSGKKWEQTMHHDYGYFKGSKGKDGDHVDVFIGPDLDSEIVFIVNQVIDGKFDEHKVVIGATNEVQARKVYLANYEDGWDGLGSIKSMTVADFKNWVLDHGQTKKQAAAQADATEEQETEEADAGSDGSGGDSGLGEGQAEERPTLAVDLDGTLAQMYKTFDPKVIMPPRPGARKWMKKFKEAGVTLIINTVRGDDAVTKAWLEEHDIPYDHINENPNQPPGSSDKIYADVYWDDRAVSAKGQLVGSVGDVAERLNVKVAEDAVIYNDPQEVWDFIQLYEAA